MIPEQQMNIALLTKDYLGIYLNPDGPEAAAMIAQLTAERDAAFTAGARAGIAVAAGSVPFVVVSEPRDEHIHAIKLRNLQASLTLDRIRAIDPTTLTEARDATD